MSEEERGIQLPSQCTHLEADKINGCPDCLLTYDEMVRFVKDEKGELVYKK